MIYLEYPITKRHCALSLVSDPLVQKFLYSEVSEAPSCIWSSKDCDRGKWRLKQRVLWVRKQLHRRYFKVFFYLQVTISVTSFYLKGHFRPHATIINRWFSVWHPCIADGVWLPRIWSHLWLLVNDSLWSIVTLVIGRITNRNEAMNLFMHESACGTFCPRATPATIRAALILPRTAIAVLQYCSIATLLHELMGRSEESGFFEGEWGPAA